MAKTKTLGSVMIPGRVDKKFIALLGLQNFASGVGKKYMLPVGTFLLSSSNGDIQKGRITQAGHCYDIVREFNWPMDDDLPHTLYGNQADPRYDPAYNLSNYSGDLKTYQCDACKFMTMPADNAFFGADFQNVFAWVGADPSYPGLNVYSSAHNSGTVPLTNSGSNAYTWDKDTGTLTFASARGANEVISIDGKAQGMQPELMLKHLFVDYGGYDPSNLSFLQTLTAGGKTYYVPAAEASNIVLPVYVNGQSKTIWQVASEIAALTAPRMVAYVIKVDELGNILFYEDKSTSTPVETLVDEHDIITMQYTYTDEQLVNVVTAQGVSNDNQSLTSIAYDLKSITENGQRSPYDIPTEMLYNTRGMNSYFALSYMNMMTASKLFASSEPIMQLTLDVIPNPVRQVGDKIYIVSKATGTTGVYVIKGLTDQIQKSQYKQQLRVQRAKLFNNFAMGLPTALTNDAAAQNLDVTQAATAGQSGIIDQISIGGTVCYAGGQQKTDVNGNPIIPIVTGSTWSFHDSVLTTQAFDTYIWRYWYLEAQNSLSSSDLMVVREANWLTFDGNKISAATIGSGYSQTTSHSSGVSLGSNTAYLRNNIIVGPDPTLLPSGYSTDMSTITFVNTGNLSTATTGLGVGEAFTGNYTYLPTNKQNYGYFCIFAVNVNGAIQFINMPFILQL